MIKQYYGTYNISHLKDSGFNHGFALYYYEHGKAAVGAFFDYSMKEQLKSLGLKWDAHARCWFTPVSTAQEAGKKMIELAEKLEIQAFSVALDSCFEKYDKHFEKWCQPVASTTKAISSSDVKIYKSYPVIKNFTEVQKAEALKVIHQIEEESDFPILPLDWDGKIFATETDCDTFLDCNDCEYDL